jgi:ATP-dependent Clp protease protease subunit
MLHQPSVGIPRSTAADIQIECDEIMKIKKELFEMISECTGQEYKKVEQDCNRDLWMRSQEALEYGIIDNIIEKKK